jgi:hypothetical protein
MRTLKYESQSKGEKFLETQKNQDASKNMLDNNETHTLEINRTWIYILLLVLILSNFIVFGIYNQSTPNGDVWTKLWTYFTTEPFKVLTISLILPLLTLFLENLFSLRNILGERLYEMKKVQEERREERKKKELEVRSECIKKTASALNELFSLISELIYFRKDSNENSEKTSIEKILKKIENISLKFNEIMNIWHFRFPNLRHVEGDETLTDFLVYFLRLLTDCTFTIIDYIEKSEDPIELKELRNTLSSIQCGVRSIIYHNSLTILKCSVEIWEYTLEKDEEKVKNAEAMIKERLDFLKQCTKWIREEELEHNIVLANSESPEVKAFRKASKNVEKLAFEDSKIDLSKSKQYLDCKEKFKRIKHNDLARCNRRCSLDWVRHISDILRWRTTCIYILERAAWARDKAVKPLNE